MRIAGERWPALTSAAAPVDPEAALAYAFVDAPAEDGWHDLGAAPLLVRPLRLAGVPLIAPFSGRARAGVREIATKDPRITRLWDRFSIDVGVAIERNATYFTERIFERLSDGYRVLVFEDGDRYAIRAMCIFRVKDHVGYIMELLHDRSVTGMRAASHLVGLSLREMIRAGADSAVAWSLGHSGSFPVLALHGFLPRKGLRFVARAFDPALEDAVSRRESWYLSYLDASDDV